MHTAAVRAAMEPQGSERFCGAGLTVRPIVRGEETRGAYAMVEVTAEPAKGSPPHVSRREDRTLYVAESAFRVRIGGRSVTLGPGASVRIPRGVVHSFTCVGYEAGRLLVSYTPAGPGARLEEIDW